jgi:hypothetical protein
MGFESTAQRTLSELSPLFRRQFQCIYSRSFVSIRGSVFFELFAPFRGYLFPAFASISNRLRRDPIRP